MRLFALTMTVGFLSVAQQALGTPIRYSQTIIATGTLGTSGFANDPVTISFEGDTLDVSGVGGGAQNLFGTMFVDVFGLGRATFTDPVLGVLDLQSTSFGPSVLMSDFTRNRLILLTVNAAFVTYDLRSPIGPISGPAVTNFGFPFPTTSGDFVLTSIVENTSTFAATTSTSTVPEPGTVMMLGAGLVGASTTLRRRRQQQCFNRTL